MPLEGLIVEGENEGEHEGEGEGEGESESESEDGIKVNTLIPKTN